MTESEPLRPRPRPCPSCPYRRDCPSGLWHPDEYRKLPGYDGDTAYQHPGVFCCHSAPDCLCAGWVAHRDPAELLALRIGTAAGTVSGDVWDYRTDVPLFASGWQAARHGLADIEHPGPEARAAIVKIVRARPDIT